MSSKTHDLVVKTGEYQSGGDTKARWLNVGSAVKAESGKTVFLLDRTFNPAGVSGEGNSESVMIQAFPVDENRQQSQKQAPATDGFEDSQIPF